MFKSHLPTIASPETQEESRPSHINLLVAVTRSGRIHSRVYGSLPIGDNQLPGEARQVRSLHISADLSQLWIVSDVESTDTSKARVVLDIVPSGLDASFKRDLKLIADKTEALNVLLRYLETVVKLMDEEQTKVLETSNGYFKKFVEVLYDHGTSNTPIAELKYMLATGKRTESIEMFLTQHVGERVGPLAGSPARLTLFEKNIRQWEKTVEQGCQSLKSHTVEFLKPACERLHILLSGLAVVPPRCVDE